ncbi:MAG: glycosyltransferase family 2 protein [Solirubrobacterales bacterium]
MQAIKLSIVVPALNESEALPGLLGEIAQACESLGLGWEAIVVDDGSTDGSMELVERLGAQRPEVRGIRLRRNFGKSAALAAGFNYSAGETIVTIDGDGQDDPADIPALLDELSRGADLVSGWKRQRRDPLSRRLASRVFNRVTKWLTGVSMHDMNCGLKAYRGDCARSLNIYGELHRYVPVLAVQQGWRVAELPINHRSRRHGRSRFGVERYLRGALDLLTVIFIGRYQYRPLHLFGGLGIGATALGAAISLYLTALKIGGEAIGDRPLLFLSVLLIVVGIQLLTFGLLAQMVVLARQDRGAAALSAAQVERLVGFSKADDNLSGDSARSATASTAPG